MATTTLRIKQETKEEFDTVGHYGDTADTILARLINVYKRKKKLDTDDKYNDE